MPRAKVTQEQIDATLSAFKDLPDPVAKARLFSKLEAVKGMKSEIQGLLKRGFLLEDVVKAMAGTGIDITTSALKTYMSKTVSKVPAKTVSKTAYKAVGKKPAEAVSDARSASPANPPAGSGRFDVQEDVV